MAVSAVPPGWISSGSKTIGATSSVPSRFVTSDARCAPTTRIPTVNVAVELPSSRSIVVPITGFALGTRPGTPSAPGQPAP